MSNHDDHPPDQDKPAAVVGGIYDHLDKLADNINGRIDNLYATTGDHNHDQDT